uniref:Uncharacterized protein n=1 Tax=Callorhinchus milii TaxID=7868 RepID=A0A4W3GQA8_CALMI
VGCGGERGSNLTPRYRCSEKIVGSGTPLVYTDRQGPRFRGETGGILVFLVTYTDDNLLTTSNLLSKVCKASQ